MPYNKALLNKLDKQNTERASAHHYKSASDSRYHRDQRYWVVNSAGLKFLLPITLEEFVRYLGPRASLGVYKQYTLHPIP